MEGCIPRPCIHWSSVHLFWWWFYRW